MNLEKIGEVNYISEGKEFKTEFSLTSKVKQYLENEKVSLAVLLPDGWEWYEADLFDVLDDENTGYANEKYGKNFEVIYYGVVEGLDLVEEDLDSENSQIKEEGFSDDFESLDEEGRFIYSAATGLSSVKDANKCFNIKYIVRKK